MSAEPPEVDAIKLLEASVRRDACWIRSSRARRLNGGPRGCQGLSDAEFRFLALPLCHHHHQGEEGIHTGVRTWEKEFGDQAWHLERMGRMLDCDLFAMAAAEGQTKRANRRYTPPTKQVPRNAA